MNQIIKVNNFTIIYNYFPKAKTTIVEAYVNNGCIFENKDNAGISHLLEHIVCEGWGKCNGPCIDYWKKKGVQTNASTGQTFINYYMHGLTKYAEEIIDYICGISMKPIMTLKRVKKEKIAVKNELFSHLDYPETKMYNALNKILFKNEGLQIQDDLQLQLDNLKKINLNQLKEWTNKFYQPGNMVFIVSGNVKKTLVQKTFRNKLSKYKNKSTESHSIDLFQLGNQINFVSDKSAKGTTIHFVFPSPLTQKDKEIHFIKLFAKLVNSEITSILFKTLREKNSLIYTLRFEENIYGYGSYIIIKTQCKNTKSTKKVVKLTIETLKNLANGKFDHEYLNYIKELYLVEYLSQCQNPVKISTRIGEQYINQIHNISNAKIFTHKEIAKMIEDITFDEFIIFIKKLLIFANMKIVYKGPNKVFNLHSLVQRKM